MLSQKLRIKEQTFVSNVNERSKTLESESFPLAFSNLALLRKCILAGEMGSKGRLEWAEAEGRDERGPHLGARQFFPMRGCECKREAAVHSECGVQGGGCVSKNRGDQILFGCH